jgi:GNAT superfamily N-acetyltransferase
MDDALLSQPIVPLDDSHDRHSFHCGVEPLDRYLHLQAGQDQRRHVAACFILLDSALDRIAGYYTLSAFSVVGEALPAAFQRKLPKYGQIPATLLGRLAVDTEYRGLGLGGHLLVDALERAVMSSAKVASWAVVVDAKDHAAKQFYSHYGFIELPETRGRMFLPIATAAKLFSG